MLMDLIASKIIQSSMEEGAKINSFEWRKYTLAIVDIILVNLSYIIAYYLRFNFKVPDNQFATYKQIAIVITLIYLIIFFLFKLYKSLWSYASIDEFMLVILACIVANLLTIAYGLIIKGRLPFSISLIAGIIGILFIGGFRMSFRIYKRYMFIIDKNEYKDPKRIMVIGAGSAGTMLVKEMKQRKELGYNPVALIDDDKYKTDKIIAGVEVKGTRDCIEKVCKEMHIDEILIAIACLDGNNKKSIIDICKNTGCKVRIMPAISEIIDGQVTLSKIRDISMEDLLGREPVKLDMKGIREYINGRKIMITGGGGSIGSELCRQIINFNPQEIVIVDNYENNEYELQQELKRKKTKVSIKFVIASVRDRNRLEQIFEKFKPELVFHAAAHKHVPLMEDNPGEAVKNNIFGTLNLAECADKYKVKRFVMISTDKAVNPTNIMGASKRVCEMIVQSIDKKSETQFVAVRFGNVLGSNGSVVPLFMQQIKEGGPLTVTHKEINRFFMTIPEAAQLVLQAGVFAKGGEIFVLDMENPVKIYDLACDLIRLSGLEPNKDIKIEFIGLRPGEKLYEEVLTEEEGLSQTPHNKIYVGKPTFSNFDSLKEKIEKMKQCVEKDDREVIIKNIEELVPTYKRFNVEEVASSIEE